LPEDTFELLFQFYVLKFRKLKKHAVADIKQYTAHFDSDSVMYIMFYK